MPLINYEKDDCVPGPVKDVFNYMLKLLSQVQKLASERFILPETYKDDEPFTEYFPSIPLHSGNKPESSRSCGAPY